MQLLEYLKFEVDNNHKVMLLDDLGCNRADTWKLLVVRGEG